ncbi:hypothetical protein CASFOL_003209 [Castilleja foliolosa]|uniref:DNA-directed RNA polymerase III subunit RPC3 n=1 Tax=Castilleja foliolosa TaxID=1961234 RepID=A0ABD3EGI1_9LAMI
MVSTHGVQFAAHLISSFYGDLCSKVCECLLLRGNLTLLQITQSTELTRENVINCLRVLIHQNCVQAFSTIKEGSFGEAPRTLTQYMALFDNIIHKLRAPKFMQIVSEELGKDCVGIFQGLVQHGRLSFKQITERNEDTTGRSDIHVVQENFNKLLSARFIERCPAPDPFLAPPSEDENASKKRGPKSKIAEKPQSTEERALAAAAPMESMRFLMEMDDVAEKDDEESTNKPGKKRKHGLLRLDEDVLDSDKKKEVLWRVNSEEFIRRLRNKACLSYVKAKLNDEAGIVLNAVLELSAQSDNRPKIEKTPYLSLNAIIEEVIKKEDGLGMNLDRIEFSLKDLGCETLSVGLEDSYSIDIKGIIEMAQNEEVESVVLKRYGIEAYRIYRLLSKANRFCETDKISDSTFVEKKDALKILYTLWKSKYLHMEIATTTGGARQMQFMLWRVYKQALWELFLDEMYHAALNLRLRNARVEEQAKEVSQLPKEKLVGELAKKYERVRRVRVILGTSLIDLDDVIMLFHDF